MVAVSDVNRRPPCAATCALFGGFSEALYVGPTPMVAAFRPRPGSGATTPYGGGVALLDLIRCNAMRLSAGRREVQAATAMANRTEKGNVTYMRVLRSSSVRQDNKQKIPVSKGTPKERVRWINSTRRVGLDSTRDGQGAATHRNVSLCAGGIPIVLGVRDTEWVAERYYADIGPTDAGNPLVLTPLPQKA